jgi:hypothetical protein
MNLYFKIITSLIPFVLGVNCLNAQSIRFMGSVLDEKTNQPIPYVNLAVYNMPIGASSNFNGDFLLNLPDSLENGRLDISCIGYKSRSFPIDSLMGSDTLVIWLTPIDYQLKDIVVTPGENDVHTILKRVISRIDNNYPGKKYFLEAFFRHRVYNQFNEKKTVRLTEAALSIHQDHTSKEKKKVQVNEIRNSENYAELSTSAGRKLLYHALGGHQNPVYRSLMVENYAQKKFLRALTKSKHYSVAINEVTTIGDDIVYVIDFRQESWEFMFKKYNTTHTYGKFRYYVNANDFAILKAENINISYNPVYEKYLKKDSIIGQQFIQYRKFDGKYYPSYVYFSGVVPDMVTKIDENNYYSHEAELMVNEIATRRKDYERIRYRNQLTKDKTLWDMDYEYNTAFWENYNLLLDQPLNLQYKKDLEADKPLEEQFKKK